MSRTLIRTILQNPDLDREVIIQGWVRTRRDSKGFSFLEINDGSCFESLQVVANEALPNYQEAVLQAHTGASVSVRGQLTKSMGKGQAVEIQAASVDLIGACDAEGYPLQKKRHSNEFLRTINHLRPRTNTFGAVFRVRSTASHAIHCFFQERNFVHVHTPIITGSDCEGAGKMFQVTTLDMLNPPKNGEGAAASINYGDDFFGKPVFLTVSGQLEGEAFACSLGNIYTFGPTFRAENSNTPRHLAEFWMVEPEMAFCDLAGNADLAEAFIKYVVSYVLERCPRDMQFFDEWVEKGIIASLTALVKASFERVDYTTAIELLQKSGKDFQFKPEWGIDIQTEHERYLAEEYFKRPVFVMNYPRGIKAFYMRLNDDGRTVRAMDLLVPRLGEIIGGAQREERKDILIQRMRESGLNEEHYQWYLDTRRYGTVPHAGFGLGFERLVMYLTGVSNVRDVIPFPRTPGNA